MSFVQVSLDGATLDTHERLRGVRGSFDKAVQSLKNLNEESIDTAVAFCPTKFNVNEFENCLDLASELGCRRVRVQPLMIIGNALLNSDILRPTAEQYRELVEVIKFRSANGAKGVYIEWGDPIFHLRQIDQLGLLYTEIKSDGSIGVSAYLPIFLGNLRKYSLSEYWEAGLYRVGKLPVLQDLAERIRSVEDLSRIDPIPFHEYGDYVRLDLIDDRDKLPDLKMENLA
jgi:MoaA/NifB/PqqE/SkfB family radical SAM enzyme